MAGSGKEKYLYCAKNCYVLPGQINQVVGVVYEISAEDETTLDKKEGVALGRYRKETLSIVIDDDQIPCLVYIAPIETAGVPGEEYVRRIEDGIADAKLPAEYVARYMKQYLKHFHESDNVFLDLGYASDDAEILRLRADMMAEVRRWISD